MHLVGAIEDILATPPRCGGTHVIAIDGRAGSGKTTLAHELFLALTSERTVHVINLDEIYAGWDKALDSSLTQALHQILDDFSQKKSTWVRQFNWAKESFDISQEIPPCTLLIIEGVGSGQKIVREYASATIWLDIDPAIGLQRVLQRDGAGISQRMHQWQIDEDHLFESDKTRENADFVLSTI
ncbi:MAG: hypothetical protein D4R83_05350 [Streptomycetaceae bacterium]|nr:MAG: hypothetical protein D4R83_05350 [Streptomycetaceae bacterium]